MPERARSGAGRGGPARGYSWPPFQPGNEVALRHGAYRSDLTLSRDGRVAELVEEVWRTQPVGHPADEGAVWRLALVYRRLELSAAALDAADAALAADPLAGYRDDAQYLGRLREDHARWLREAGRIEAELARTPASRAKLGLHLALGERAVSLTELHRRAALEKVQAQLGHHDLAFTRRVYVHTTAGEDGPDPELLADLAGDAPARRLRVVGGEERRAAAG